jgi:hypothetical protein
MYQRRQKRVAGPGFHVNVKMDQFQIATMRGRNGMTNQSSLLPSSSAPEIYDIKEQEILVAKRTSGSMYHDGYTHVFSALNGYDCNGLQAKQDIIDYILSDVKFVGIATTEQKADDRLIDQGCVATVAGVQTILNNGKFPIHPTQKVMLDINLEPSRASITREKGIPRQKVRFSVRPADDDLAMIKKAASLCTPDLTDEDKAIKKEEVEEAKARLLKAEETLKPLRGKGRDSGEDDARKARDEAKRAYERAKSNLAACRDKVSLGDDPRDLQHFLQNYRHLNELVIGKAMSYAAPGDRFEILLQPRHSL